MKLGFPNIDKHLHFKSNELIVIGGRPAMGKTSFALNIIARNTDSKGCIISLLENKESLKNKQKSINSILANELSIVNKEEVNTVEYLEMPSLIELVELIVKIKDKYDFFIIDDLTFIETGIKPFFSNDKNYQTILRHLKSLCLALNKNIFVLTNIHRKVEKNNLFNFSYYGMREKYIDAILVLHRPEYYRIIKDEFGEGIKKGDTRLLLAKYNGITPEIEEFSLLFDSKKLTFSCDEKPVFS